MSSSTLYIIDPPTTQTLDPTLVHSMISFDGDDLRNSTAANILVDMVAEPTDAKDSPLNEEECEMTKLPEGSFPKAVNRAVTEVAVGFGAQPSLTKRIEKTGWSEQELDILRACLCGAVTEHNRKYYRKTRLPNAQPKVVWRSVCQLLSAVNPTISREPQQARCAWLRLRQEGDDKMGADKCLQIVANAEQRLLSLPSSALESNSLMGASGLSNGTVVRGLPASNTDKVSPPMASPCHTEKQSSRTVLKGAIHKSRKSGTLLLNPTTTELMEIAVRSVGTWGRCSYCGADTKNGKPHPECVDRFNDSD